MHLFRTLLPCLLLAACPLPSSAAEQVIHPQPDARRLEIMFLGAPTPLPPRRSCANSRPMPPCTCVACHGLDGQGVAGAFPPITGVSWMTGDPTLPIRIVMHGLIGPIEVNGTQYDSVMPPVVGLSDADIANVVTYVRQSFGNDASAVTETEVRNLRQRTRGRRDLWKVEELTPLPAR